MKIDGGSSYETYPALLESRFTTLTGTGYRRITQYRAKHL